MKSLNKQVHSKNDTTFDISSFTSFVQVDCKFDFFPYLKAQGKWSIDNNKKLNRQIFT